MNTSSKKKIFLSVVALSALGILFQNCARLHFKTTLVPLPGKANTRAPSSITLKLIDSKEDCSFESNGKHETASATVIECDQKCASKRQTDPALTCRFKGEQVSSIHQCQIRDQNGNSIAESSDSTARDCFSVCKSYPENLSRTCSWGQLKFSVAALQVTDAKTSRRGPASVVSAVAKTKKSKGTRKLKKLRSYAPREI